MTSTLTPPVGTSSARRGLLAVSAVCAAVTVANIYLAQPVVGLVAADFGVPAGSAGWVATGALLGYALGIALLVPLGDVLDRRRLVARLSVLTAMLLVGAALAPALPVLAVLAGAAAMTTVIPQVVIPLVAQAAGEARGRAVAAVQAGLIAGIMLSRTVGGALGQWCGWRAVYLVAAGLTALVGLTAARLLAPEPAKPAVPYRALIGSVLRMVAEEPGLRWACVRQAATFGAFSAVWTTLAVLLTGAPFHLGVGAAGLVGLLGLSGAVAAPLAGRLVDRWGGARVGVLGLVGLLALVPVLVVGGRSLPVLLLAVLLVPVATQVSQVGNQSAALAVRPAAGARLNTAYMLATFLAGAAGSAAGTAAQAGAGWLGCCLVAGGFAGAGLLATGVRAAVRIRR